ncbi:MAG: TonB-dependent receptor [OM182 bacterium]|uniref:TonB-dependent receptor n=1 Tax=OM182 bacterium TaxID=2510334 RepID=A0A520RX93_9GAMM|nr:MAG: TonB-dependent receptor [OM182 bacterium]
MNKISKTFWLGLFVASPFTALASLLDQSELRYLEEIVVIGDRQNVKEIAGSGSVIDQTEIDQFDHIDLGQLLGSVPGVYIREEDGFGLRPNIGIRGATSDRSQKITIMEDGVLITPAPYSAPAAYYVPNVSRVHTIEVLKGPSAIQHGPHTVGGSINFVSRPVPDVQTFEIDLSKGINNFYKYQGAIGGKYNNLGIVLDGLAYGSDGFKALDGGGDTGFERSDFGLKLSWRPESNIEQLLTLKVGYGEEDANETYLGLTDDDLREEPTRRYRASQLANFTSDHTKVLVNYGAVLRDNWRINIKSYYNEFHRDWNKLDGFVLGPALQSVLARPNQFRTQYEILKGDTNSRPINSQTLDVTSNDRSFESKGIQLSLTQIQKFGSATLESKLGLRLHKDHVERQHSPVSYLMMDGNLVPNGISRPYKTWNKAQSDAFAIYLAETVAWKNLSMEVGARLEKIDGKKTNFATNTSSKSAQDFTSPGLGLIYKFNEKTTILAGAYLGFSPPGPGSTVEAEHSLNYEYGIRYSGPVFGLEVVGFHSDYEELIGRCRVSDSDCKPGKEFNGGEVKISGVEISSSIEGIQFGGLSFFINGNYTYTNSAFESTFFSGFSQWGLVKAEDELPYLPEHTGQIGIGIEGGKWSLISNIKFQSKMREEPGQGVIEEGLHADDYVTADVTASYFHNDKMTIQIIMQNVTDEAVIIAHRPYGARPNHPRSLIGRIKYQF